jgi:hypothetical protein
MKYTKNKKNNKDKNNKNILTRKQKGGESSYIFKSQGLTTQENRDTNYKEIGIIHITESGAINILRSAATGLFNLVGNKGFDNKIYDETRNKALKKIYSQLSNNQKVCNLKMEIENVSESQLFFIHIYGTLLEKK